MRVRSIGLLRTRIRYFGHGNIIKYCHRPFLAEEDKKALERDGVWHHGNWKGEGSSKWRISREAVDLMDEYLIQQINKHVGENDVLWHLGDWAFAPKHYYYDTCKQYRNRIKCKNVYLVWGNHDHHTIANLFSNTYDLTKTWVDGQQIIMCHYAMVCWEDSHRSAFQLYGHSHSGAEPWMDQHMVGRKSIDVGVDNAAKILGEYRPFAFEELKKIFDSKAGFSADHHAPKNSQAPREAEAM